MDTAIFDTLSDAMASETLKRLHRQAGKLDAGLIVRFARLAPRILTKRSVPWNQLERDFDTDFLAVEPDYGVFCYQMARALRARRIVEFGTSFGLSTIYLALAVRDNGGGEVIGTELVPAKAEKARDHLREAGVEQYVDIRVGDVRETLSTLDGEVDMHLNDGFPHLALPVLQRVAPLMRSGAVALNANTGYMPADHTDYLAWVRNPGNGFCSWALPKKFGEFSVKTV